MSDTPQNARVRVVSAEIARDGLYLITQRMPNAVLPGLWEFPGGRVRPGESDADALRRALTDRLGCDVLIGTQAMRVEHAYETYTLEMCVYRCALPDGAEPVARRVADLAWVGPEQFGRYPFPGADQQTVDALLGDM